MSTVEMNEVKKPIEYSYTVFNNENWQYNVDKAFFLIACGVLYSIIRLAQNNFEASAIELFARLFSGPFVVVAMIVLIEATAAVLVKVAFNPGELIESKFMMVPKIFFNTFKESYSNVLYFKQVNSVKTITVNPPGLLYGRLYLNAACGLNMQGESTLPGYMKIPEHFKY